jgi:hypothetical protein
VGARFKEDWDRGDAAGLRHYHPPLALYPVALFTRPEPGNERTLRSTSVAVGTLACLAAAWLAFALLDGMPVSVRIVLAGVAGLLTAGSPYHLVASGTLGPHALFSLLSVVALAALTLAQRGSTWTWWLVACAALGLAVLTVPNWALLVPAFAVVWWRLRRRLGSGRLLLAGLGAVLAVATLAWPPFLLRADFVKSILMYGGLIIRPLAGQGGGGTWLASAARAHVIVVALCVAAVVGLPAVARDRRVALLPVTIYVGGFLLLNLRVSFMKALYAADLVGPLAALATATAGLALVRLAPRIAPAVASAMLVLAAAGLVVRAPAPRVDPHWRGALAQLDRQLAGRRVLVTPRPAGAMITYYLGDADVLLDSSDPEDRRSILAGLRPGDVVLRWGSQTEPGGVARTLIPQPAGRSTTIDGTVVTWWDLAR